MPLLPLPRPQLLTAKPNRTDDIDAFLSSDADRTLEDSFASNVSLNSPPRPQLNLPSDDDESREFGPMDISPAPQRVLPTSKSQPYRFEEDVTAPLPPISKVGTIRPRSSTTSGSQRLFGKDVSNNKHASGDAWAPLNIVKSNDKDRATEKHSKRSQRGGLPFDWVKDGQAENDVRKPSIMSCATKVCSFGGWSLRVLLTCSC